MFEIPTDHNINFFNRSQGYMLGIEQIFRRYNFFFNICICKSCSFIVEIYNIYNIIYCFQYQLNFHRRQFEFLQG